MKKGYITPSVVVHRLSINLLLIELSKGETLQKEEYKFVAEDDEDVVTD